MVARVLSIAGSDSGGGAGIQADLKTVAALGGHGMSAVTAVTAQNTLGVAGIHPIPPAFVRLQIEAVADDIGVDAVKTGMLANSEVVAAVAEVIAERGLAPLVVDPVLAAESGAGLMERSAEAVLLDRLLPLATIVTPNAVEAARLTGIAVTNVAGQREAAAKLAERGAAAVLVKGGHLDQESATDVLLVGGELYELHGPWIDARNTHGTGCILASAIAFHLGAGADLRVAVDEAKRFVAGAIAAGLDIGRGAGPANPFWAKR
jgi:hydroxymethylpyrimidine/phosphomethylpyrimidine kinase